MYIAVINQNGGYEFVIAPFWKRVVAEIIDSLILLLLKLVLTFTVVDLFDLNLYVPKSYEANYKQYAINICILIVLQNSHNIYKIVNEEMIYLYNFSYFVLVVWHSI